MKKKTWLAAIVILICGITLHAGWVIEEINTNPDGEQTTRVNYIQDNKMMMMMGDEQVIFDLDAQQETVIMPEQGIFMNFTPEILESIGKMGGAAPEWHGSVEVRKTSEKETIAGYSATKHQVFADGELKQEVWIAKDLDMTKEINLDQFFQMMNTRLEEASYTSTPEFQDLFKSGYPLKQVSFEEEGKDVTVVTKVEQKSIPKSQFEVPEGLQEMDMQQMMGR